LAIRAHHQAATRKGVPRRGLVRSKGGFTTISHLWANTAGLPMRTQITPGQTSDYSGVGMIATDTFAQPRILLADGGSDADKIQQKRNAKVS
jgi:hypothetical protein